MICLKLRIYASTSIVLGFASFLACVIGCTPQSSPGPTGAVTKELDVLNLLNGSLRLHLIPAGARILGSDNSMATDPERPRFIYRLDSPIYMGSTEVTLTQYREVIRDTTIQHDPELPVSVTWKQANDFCVALLNRFDSGIPSGWTIRLPSEAEWEYVAMYDRPTGEEWWPLGTPERGKDARTEYDMGKHEWFDANSGGQPHQVGTKLPNSLGIHDLLGNEREWCAGWFSNDSSTLQLALYNMAESGLRPVRGGDYLRRASECRPSIRVGLRDGMTAAFRIVAVRKP